MAGDVRVVASLRRPWQRSSPLGMFVALWAQEQKCRENVRFSERRLKICRVFLKDVWKDMRKTLYFPERRCIFYRRVLIRTFY